MKFEELDLNYDVLDALDDMHFSECTPIQEQCIPQILDGHDVLGVAQTGTGKTAAYLLPILSNLADGGYPDDSINCLIMSPTRELAQQIDEAMQGFSYYLQGVSSVAVYGGNDGNRYDQEYKSLTKGADVVIATPGRFISHMNMGNVDLSRVSFFILDEADRMLDMGFSEDIMTIARKLPPSCQTIMFSATMPKKIEELAKTLLKNPVEVKLAVSKPAEKIHQMAYVCYEGQKLDIIKHIFKQGQLNRVIIFSGSKLKVKQINASLQRMGINCDQMQSDLSQAERDEVMFRFKSGKTDVLVATDIVARGIDIDDITLVINFDVPRDSEDYVHRIGRTARAERDGEAITLVSVDDFYYFQQIEKFLEKEVEKVALPEGLGEAPEYTQQARPSRGQKTSAKARRRKDRDQQSHKDKKRRNKSAKPERQEKADVAEKTAVAAVPEKSVVSEKSDKSDMSEKTEKSPKPRRKAKQHPAAPAQSDKPAKPEKSEKSAKSEKSEKPEQSDKQSAQPAQPAQPKKRKSKHRRKAKPEQPAQPSTKYTSILDVNVKAKKPQGGIKGFFKKLFGK